jgi:hypothetical protein
MKTNGALEIFAVNINDMASDLPKGRGRCFDIGSWGGCGVSCGAFADGECTEPQEIDAQDVRDEHGDEAVDIFNRYECYSGEAEVQE